MNMNNSEIKDSSEFFSDSDNELKKISKNIEFNERREDGLLKDKKHDDNINKARKIKIKKYSN